MKKSAKKKNERYRFCLYISKGVTETISAKSKKELKEKVEKRRAELKKERENKSVDVSLNCTFSFWGEKWLEKMKKKVENNSLSNGTYVQYESAFKHLKRHFTKTQFYEFDIDTYQQFIDKLSVTDEEVMKGKKGLSKSTIHSIIVVTKCIFDYAKANRVASVPGTEFLSQIEIRTKSPKVKRSLTFEEIEMFLDTPFRLQTISLIMLFGGLRRGEALALRWEDIDLKNGYIDVNKSVEFINGKPIVKPGGKTSSALRSAPIPPILIEHLKKVKKEILPLPNALVCTNRKGKEYTESSFKKDWDLYLKKLNAKYGYNIDIDNICNTRLKKMYDEGLLPWKIEKFTTHYFRHTYATLLYLENVPIRNSMIYLGHSSINVTTKIYEDYRTNNIFKLSQSDRIKLDNEYKIA